MSMPSSIPLFTPQLQGNEWNYVKECLDTAWVSSAGSFVDEFERRLAAQFDVQHAVATVNGTSALHAALLGVGVEPETEVLVSTLTFAASANSIRHANAWPLLVDAEQQHWQMDPRLLESFLAERCTRKREGVINRSSGRRVSAIMPVHILGHSVDMHAVMRVAEQFDLPVVEDAAEAIGVEYQGRPAGSFGHAACVSFNGNKLITTGGGGAVLSDSRQIADRVRYLTTQARDDPQEYVHGEVGYNYRLPNLLAAMGCAQLENLESFITRKRQQASQYAARLADVAGLDVYTPAKDVRCTFWMNVIRVCEAEFGLGSRQLIAALAERGVQCRPLWQPMHATPAHAGCEAILSGVADSLFRDCVCLPSSVGLTPGDVDRVCAEIERAPHRRAAA